MSFNESSTSKEFLLVQNEWSRGVQAIFKHLRNIFESEELVKKSVISILEITTEDNKKLLQLNSMKSQLLRIPR